MAQWQCFLSFAVVAVSAAASLGAILRVNRLRRPPRADDDGSAAAPPPPPWISCWSRVPPACLLAFRATATVALAAVLAWDARTYDLSIMMYYTEWTLVLEIAYFAAATLCSAYGCRMMYSYSSREAAEDPESNDDRLLGPSGGDELNPNGDAWKGAGRLELLMQIGYQVQLFLLDRSDHLLHVHSLYCWRISWCSCLSRLQQNQTCVPVSSLKETKGRLHAGHFSLNAVMACIHSNSINLVLLLIETALNTLAFPWFRMAYFVLWTCLYVIIQWIAHVCGMTWWPYPFLRPESSLAPLWYLAMALLHFPCYLVYWLIVRAKSVCLIHMQDANRS